MKNNGRHIDAISCGQGGPSLFLIIAAKEYNLFSADVVIVADTGWENDMLRTDGRRSDARTFFEEVTKPLAVEYGLDAYFVRANDGNGKPLPPLQDTQRLVGSRIEVDIPMFGSNGGRLHQSCTSKYKVSAIRQQLRRLAAKTANSYLGITMDEVHRMKESEVESTVISVGR